MSAVWPCYKSSSACLRIGAHTAVQDKLQSWSEPFREAFAGHAGVHWFELSLVESLVRPSYLVSTLSRLLSRGFWRCCLYSCPHSSPVSKVRHEVDIANAKEASFTECRSCRGGRSGTSFCAAAFGSSS